MRKSVASASPEATDLCFTVRGRIPYNNAQTSGCRQGGPGGQFSSTVLGYYIGSNGLSKKKNDRLGVLR